MRQHCQLTKLSYIGLVATVVGAGGCLKAEPDGRRTRTFTPSDPGFKHVIFISIDTLRKDRLGCYGHPFVQTPHIDSIAQEGWRFTRCLMNERFKVIHRPLKDEWELYHIAKDPAERIELMRVSGSGIDFKNDPLLIEMKAQLAARDESADPLPTFEEVADTSRQNLRALGYTGGEATPRLTGPLGDWTNTGL